MEPSLTYEHTNAQYAVVDHIGEDNEPLSSPDALSLLYTPIITTLLGQFLPKFHHNPTHDTKDEFKVCTLFQKLPWSAPFSYTLCLSLKTLPQRDTFTALHVQILRMRHVY